MVEKLPAQKKVQTKIAKVKQKRAETKFDDYRAGSYRKRDADAVAKSVGIQISQMNHASNVISTGLLVRRR